MVRRRMRFSESSASRQLVAEIQELARPLQKPSDLEPLLRRIRNAKVVLLGEASHGTHEYYTWRTAITQRLVEEAGFSFVAVEGDWPDCYDVTRFVKGYPQTSNDVIETLHTFRRWPTWMWANEEVRDLITWLRDWNGPRPSADQIGFYGLDMYSLWESLYAVMGFLKKHQPDALPAARRALQCFEPFGEDAQEYARFTSFVPRTCEDDVVKLLAKIRSAPRSYRGDGRDEQFAAEQNALVVKNAEKYYRTMMRSDDSSWNVRDRHMADTLDRLLTHHGPAAKAIVWEHNTHVGDARFTDMADDGMVNVGQLAREMYGPDSVAIVGFGSHHGTVIAGDDWDAPWEIMTVPAARTDSWESVLHEVGAENKLLVFSGGSKELAQRRGHRAIGVVYHPDREQFGNYVPTVLPKRYDAFLYIDETTAVRPLIPAAEAEVEELPETYPSGV